MRRAQVWTANQPQVKGLKALKRALTIVHVSNFLIRAKGAFQHGVGPKISNGLIRNGHNVLNFCDRDVARASSFFGRKALGKRGARKILRDFCQSVRPDLLLLGHADIIDSATVAEIRSLNPDMRVVQWNVDPLFEEENLGRIQSKFDVVDATLISTAGPLLHALHTPGRTLGFLPNPADASIESGHNHERTDLPYDVFYCCTNPGRPLREICGTPWNMEDFMRMLQKELPQLKPRLGGLLGHPTLVGGAYQNALESAAVGLNISRRNNVLLYSSDRLAHLMGNGQAVLMERANGYDALFSDEQILFYTSIAEMIEKLRAVLGDGARRQRIAAAGRQRYYELFSEQIIARYIVDVAFGIHDATNYAWPTLVS